MWRPVAAPQVAAGAVASVAYPRQIGAAVAADTSYCGVRVVAQEEEAAAVLVGLVAAYRARARLAMVSAVGWRRSPKSILFVNWVAQLVAVDAAAAALELPAAESYCTGPISIEIPLLEVAQFEKPIGAARKWRPKPIATSAAQEPQAAHPHHPVARFHGNIPAADWIFVSGPCPLPVIASV